MHLHKLQDAFLVYFCTDYQEDLGCEYKCTVLSEMQVNKLVLCDSMQLDASLQLVETAVRFHFQRFSHFCHKRR